MAHRKGKVSGIGPVSSGRTYSRNLNRYNRSKNNNMKVTGVGPIADGAQYARNIEAARKKSSAAAAAAAKAKAAAEAKAKAEAAAKAKAAEEKRVRMFDPGRLSDTFSDSFFNQSLQAGGISNINSSVFNNPNNYLNKGLNTSFQNEGKVPFGSPRSYFQKYPNPNSLFGNDALQVGKSDQNFIAGKRGNPFGRPDQAFNIFRSADKGGPGSGPTPLTRETIKRFGPNTLSLAGSFLPGYNIGSKIFNEGRTDSALSKSLSNVDNINVGGLSIGFNSPESTDVGARVGRFFQSIPGRVVNAFTGGDEAKVASTDAGGLNIGGVDSEAGSNDLGRTISLGDKLKTIGGFAKDIGTQALFGGPTADGTLTGNTDFAGNLPGAQGYDNRDVKIKSAFNEAMNSEGVQQLGEGLGLPKNFKSQLKDTAEAGNQYFSGMTTDRNSIYGSVSDTLRDLSSNPKLGTTARYINQMTTDNPNVSDSERNKKVSFFGMKTPLSNENVADIRSAFNETNAKFQGLSKADRGLFEGGGGNRIVSGKLTDSIRGVLSGYKGDPNIGLGKGEGVTLGSMIDAAPTLASNIGTEGTLANKRINEIKRLAPGGDITTPSLIRGQLPLGGRRYGGGTNTTGGSNRSMFIPTAPAAVQQEYPLPLIPQTGVANNNLQNLQQNAYSNQMSMYATNPNYFAQFRPQQRFPRRGSFRSSFSRDYFN